MTTDPHLANNILAALPRKEFEQFAAKLRPVPLKLAIIDINEPEINAQDNLKVLHNFEQLDELLESAEW